jgi:hypothetical protein
MAFSAFNVTLMGPYMHDLDTSFGGTRLAHIANNSLYHKAGITRPPVPSASTKDPSIDLKLGVIGSIPIARIGRRAYHGQSCRELVYQH